MVHNSAQAEELTQDTFLQVYRKLKTFRGDSAFSTWLHRITVNVVLMYVRRCQSRISEVPFEPVYENGTEDAPIREQVGSPDPKLRASLDRVNLERAISNLPPGYGLVFVLHDVEGYQHGEIAELLGCSVGNCKSQLHKARLKLRKCLLGQLRPTYPGESSPRSSVSHLAREAAAA
jgi:RNA polymerase sigma-70 factor (ECF subfamily)